MSSRALAVVLHDVAPARWPACLRVLRQVRALADAAGVQVPVTLLVVPTLHGEPATPAFVRWLQRQARAGNELALHGWTHRDDGPPSTTLFDRPRRRWYTAGEGEFAAIPRAEAERRIALGRAWAADRGLVMPGFVAPAWLLGAGAWSAVEAAGFRYTCTLTEVVAWPGRRVLHARGIVFSTRSAWRRAASVVWNTAVAASQRNAPLLRLELHPDDADHDAVRACWSRVLAQALRERTPLRLADVAASIPHHGTPPALAAP